MTGNTTSSISSLRALQAYGSASLQRARSFAQLATGARINRAADDPAGLIASQGLARTLAALDAETSANQRASDQAAVADGALGQISDLLTQAKTLVNANANTGGLSVDAKAANQLQIDSILSTVDRFSSTTSFAGRKLLDGSATLTASGKSLAIASSSSANLGTSDIGGTSYSLADLESGKPLSTLGDNAAGAAQVIDQAIKDVGTQRATLGAFDKNTLQTRINSIASSRGQLLSALSMLRDTDYTLAAVQQSRDQILQLSSVSALMATLGRRRISTFSIWG